MTDRKDVPWDDDDQEDYSHTFRPIGEVSFDDAEGADGGDGEESSNGSNRNNSDRASSNHINSNRSSNRISSRSSSGSRSGRSSSNAASQEDSSPAKLSLKNKFFGPFLGTVTIIVLIVLCIIAAQRGNRSSVYYYIEGGELFRATGSGKGVRISSGFIAGEGGGATVTKEAADRLLSVIFESSDGKYVFFPDNNTADGTPGTIYCRKADGSGKAMRLDQGIYDVTLSEKGATVLYRKDSSLCRFSLSNGVEVIDQNPRDYCANASLDIVYYVDQSGSLYMKKGSAAAEFVEKDVTSIGCVSRPGTVWFVKNSVLYKKTIDGEKQKICSDAYEDGFVLKGKLPGFYFLTYQNSYIPVTDMIKDNLLEPDAKMAEPSKPLEPERGSYPTDAEYNAALTVYRRDVENYPALVAAYNAKLTRDKIRAAAAGDRVDRRTVTLNYCDGEKLTPVVEHIFAGRGAAGEGPYAALYGATGLARGPLDNGSGAVLYLKIKDSALPSLSIADYDSYESLREALTASLAPVCVLEAAKGTKRIYFETGDVYGACCAENGSCFYYFSNRSLSTEDFDVFDLHRIDLKKMTDDIVDTKVSDKYFDPDNCIYYKEPRAGYSTAALYRNGKHVADKVIPDSIRVASKVVAFFSDYSDADGTGTFSLFNGSKVSFTGEKVHSFTLTQGGTPVFIGAYSGPGSNTLFYGTGSKEVSENVSGVR